MDLNPIVGQIFVALGALAVVLIGGARVLGWARIKLEVTRLEQKTAEENKETELIKRETASLQADAEREKNAAEQTAIFNTMVKDIMGRTTRLDDENKELRTQIAILLPLEGKVRELGLQVEIQMKDRDLVRNKHEQELHAANERASAAEEKLATAMQRIEELERKVKDMQDKLDAAGIRDTRELPVVPPQPPVSPDTLSDLGLAS